MSGSKWDSFAPACITMLETDPLLQSVHVDDTTLMPGARSLTCKWTWHCSSPGLSEQKWWAKTGSVYLVKHSQHCQLLRTVSYLSLSVTVQLGGVAFASFSGWHSHPCPESHPEPVSRTDLNCHCMFVAGCLQGTGSLSGNLGQGKPSQRCQLRKKKKKKRVTGVMTWAHRHFFSYNPWVGITNCD